KEPIVENLIHFEKGKAVGNWRDSVSGCGLTKNGNMDRDARIAFDINASLVPASLKAIAEYYSDSGYGHLDNKLAGIAHAYFQQWDSHALNYFLASRTKGEVERA